MAKITQKQLIESLKQFKEIKPRKEWAVLLKSQILATKQAGFEVLAGPVMGAKKSAGIMDVLSAVFFQKKLAYAFTAMLVLVFGALGLMRFLPIENIAQKTPAALTMQTPLKQNVVALNNKINNLVRVTKEGKTENISSAINDINVNASELAKNLKNNLTQDPQAIKDIASSLKTLADVQGTDTGVIPGIQELEQEMSHDLIAYYQGVTLTDNQKKILISAEDLYGQGKYGDALEEMYSINK